MDFCNNIAARFSNAVSFKTCSTWLSLIRGIDLFSRRSLNKNKFEMSYVFPMRWKRLKIAGVVDTLIPK